MIAFLLGVHHPVDPARVRFALSLLDELEGASDIKDEDCAPDTDGPTVSTPPKGPRRLLRQRLVQGSAPRVSKLRTVLTYLAVIIVTSGLTTIFATHQKVLTTLPIRNPSDNVPSAALVCLVLHPVDLGPNFQSSALTGHLKKCKELKQDLIEARANLGSSNPRDNTRNPTKALEWAEDLEVDAAPAITPTSEVGSPSSFDEPLLDVTAADAPLPSGAHTTSIAT
ncbi:hypothetical protein BKA70DRAFT_1235234 [Coprinopsis sp. MPI-PUGE-AT-0042]|nr:hypothetical protein BKA70DRAFT_1235234 [Coprinopsis sp. MPI-PUGE-AT-0042]